MAIVDTSILPEGTSYRSSEHVFLAQVPLDNVCDTVELDELKTRVFESWRGCLTITPLDAIQISSEPKLRQPQISALFEILAHLTSFHIEDGTVVMPTGTGKTETLLASVCGFPAERSLVIVPTDSLRLQTFKKFICLGKLRELRAINDIAMNPVVALLKGSIDSSSDLDLVLKANVVISTPQSLYRVFGELREEFFKSFTHLFVDEAHHMKAPTWRQIKKEFNGKPSIQFTATPFREDSKKVDGKIIYNYPMSKAQEEGIFRKITFKSIYEVNDSIGDKKVAEEAVKQLVEDLENGYDHILMARCKTRKRADEIFEIYKDNYLELNPVKIHTGVHDRDSILLGISKKEHRIVVCVDMLGEGFDLPELKVCALHDIHKSLAITLQFAGRFVRDRTDLGNPTFVANVCDQGVEESLRGLYIEDPDWNKVLRKISHVKIQREIELQELVDNASKSGLEVPIENLHPALSALVYNIETFNLASRIDDLPLNKNEQIASVFLPQNSELAILIIKTETPTKWAPQSDLVQPEWRLLILYVVHSEGLLFIHDSSKTGTQKKVAEHICSQARLVNGDQIFKCFGGVERLVLQNAGLNKGRRGPLRYVMYTGIDIEQAINDLAQGASYKSNLFGKGYENGNKVTIGCSYRGRVWSMDSALISDWMEWCRGIGNKLNNDSIDPNSILEKALRTVQLQGLPPVAPIGIDWPDEFFEQVSLSSIFIELDGVQVPVDEVELNIMTYSASTIEFSVSFDEIKLCYSFSINESSYTVNLQNGNDFHIYFRKKQYLISDFFSNECPPIFYYEDGSKSFGNIHIVRPEGFTIPHVDVASILKHEWSINITNESQGEERNPDSIQYSMIQKLLDEGGYWIIFDDDGPNEIADIVAFKDEENAMIVEFYHLKYSHDSKPGSRISDFYEVCGQVVKGCKWVGELDKIIAQLKKREKKRVNRINNSRIELGEFKDFEFLKRHASRIKKEYRFFIVQPGLDSTNISDDVAALLGATDLYVRETTGNPLKVISS